MKQVVIDTNAYTALHCADERVIGAMAAAERGPGPATMPVAAPVEPAD